MGARKGISYLPGRLKQVEDVVSQLACSSFAKSCGTPVTYCHVFNPEQFMPEHRFPGLLERLLPRDAQRDALSNEVALGRLSCCCVFCEEGVFPPRRQQASAVTP